MSATFNEQMADIDAVARRRDVEEKAREAISAGLIKLMVTATRDKSAKAAFFATALLRLDFRIAPMGSGIDTMATDGTRLYFDPDFTLAMDRDQLIAVLAHETLHVTNSHPARCGDRELNGWNIACDLAINHILLDCDYKLPQNLKIPGRPTFNPCIPGGKFFEKMPKDLSAEEYYALLPEKCGRPGSGEGGNDPGGMGGVLLPGNNSPSARAEADAVAKRVSAAASQAAAEMIKRNDGRGDLPGSLLRQIEVNQTAAVDWHSELADFVDRQAKTDYSFSRPNRRFIGQNLILPGYSGQALGTLVISIDVSGSVSNDILEEFGAEVQGVLDAYDCQIHVIYHDAAVQNVTEWKSSDGPIPIYSTGGGGTSHVPVFDWIRENLPEPPTCLIALTDLYTEFPGEAPGYPVLWAVVGNEGKAPWGRTIHVPESITA